MPASAATEVGFSEQSESLAALRQWWRSFGLPGSVGLLLVRPHSNSLLIGQGFPLLSAENGDKASRVSLVLGGGEEERRRRGGERRGEERRRGGEEERRRGEREREERRGEGEREEERRGEERRGEERRGGEEERRRGGEEERRRGGEGRG